MNKIIYQRIQSDPRFQELVSKHQRFALLLALIMLVLYYGFILLIAFTPNWLGTPLHPGTSVTRGIPARHRPDCGLLYTDRYLRHSRQWRVRPSDPTAVARGAV